MGPSVGGRVTVVMITNDTYKRPPSRNADTNSVPNITGFIARAGLSVIRAVTLKLSASTAETRALKGSDAKAWRRRPWSN